MPSFVIVIMYNFSNCYYINIQELSKSKEFKILLTPILIYFEMLNGQFYISNHISLKMGEIFYTYDESFETLGMRYCIV